MTEAVPPGAVGMIHWWLRGSDESINSGYVDTHSPVEVSSWGAIKSLYR